MEVTSEHRRLAQMPVRWTPTEGEPCLPAFTKGYLAAIRLIQVDENAPVGPCPTWRSDCGPENLIAYTTPTGDIAVQDEATGDEISLSGRGEARDLAYALLALVDLAERQQEDGSDA